MTTGGIASVCPGTALCLAARNRNGEPLAGGDPILFVGTGLTSSP